MNKILVLGCQEYKDESGFAYCSHFSNIILESTSIIYAGALSGGIAFTLQMFAQKNIEEAPAAIIYSLEGVFAVIAAWIILSQVLELDNINKRCYDCIIIPVAHSQFSDINIEEYIKNDNSLIYDLKGIYNNKNYRRL